MKIRIVPIIAGIGQAIAIVICAYALSAILDRSLGNWTVEIYVVSVCVGGLLIMLYPIHLFGQKRTWDAVLVFSSTLLSLTAALFVFRLVTQHP